MCIITNILTVFSHILQVKFCCLNVQKTHLEMADWLGYTPICSMDLYYQTTYKKIRVIVPHTHTYPKGANKYFWHIVAAVITCWVQTF